MDTLTVDVRDLPGEKVWELKRLIEHWKGEQRSGGTVIKKRKVDPSEFTPHLTRFKAPLTRDLAYEE